MESLVGIVGVVGALVVMMGAVWWVQRVCRVSGEVSRKAVHVGMGAVCLGFPWIFTEVWAVWGLAGLAFGGLLAVRVVPILRRALGGVLSGVARESWGELYFPVAVAVVFTLAAGDWLLYVIPVLTLTLADSVGALVGGRYGLATYRTDEGRKSAEGSVAFFTVAFLSCHVPLLLFGGVGRAESLLIGLTAGFVVMLLEAVAWRGQDNLIIPVGMYFLLQFYLPLGVDDLAVRFAVILGLVALVVVWRKRTTLSDSAVLVGALAGYAVWAFGGWLWLVAPVILFGVYVGLPGFSDGARPVQDLHAVTRVMAGGFVWLGAGMLVGETKGGVADSFVVPFILCLAAHTGNIVVARLRVVREGLGRRRILLIGWGVASGLFVGLMGVAVAISGLAWGIILVVPAAVAVSVVAFWWLWPLRFTEATRLRAWVAETMVAWVVSVPGLWLIL